MVRTAYCLGRDVGRLGRDDSVVNRAIFVFDQGLDINPECALDFVDEQ